jgi:hypothetical protein
MICERRSDKVTAIGVALYMLLPPSAHAQDASTNPCWEVTAPSVQRLLLLINKCTGKTWLLIKVNVRKAKSGLPGVYTYRWRPITADDTGEPTFSTLP